jgi:uncharacterized protein (DUF849 family)
MRTKNEKLLINFTPTGMIPTKKMTPHVPITPEEIIEDVHSACELGITIVHLHARDLNTGEPTYKAEIYSKIIEGIKKFSKDLIICVSLSGRTFKEFEKRSEPLDIGGSLKPDMGSLTLSSLNFIQHGSMNEPGMIRALAEKMNEKGIKPELEAFDSGMINFSKYLIKKEIIKPPFYYNLILGNIANAQADMLNAGMLVQYLPEESIWSFGGIGASQLEMNSIAIAAGGGVRIGLEDNIWYSSATNKLASNMDLLKRIHRIAQANEREIMKPCEAREILNMEN